MFVVLPSRSSSERPASGPVLILFQQTGVANSEKKYPGAVDRLLQAVQQIIPGIGPTHTTIFNYIALGDYKYTIGKANGKLLTNYDPEARLVHSEPFGYQIWSENNLAVQDEWGSCTGNQKRQDGGSCPLSASNSGPSSASSPISDTTSASTSDTSSGRSGFSTSISTAKPSSITATSATSSAKSLVLCTPHMDPDAGPGHNGCQCSGTTGLIPMLSNTASATNFNPCGYTELPTSVTTSSVSPFTTRDVTNGDVLRCASSTYYNFAVNDIAKCAGSSTVFSTVSSIYTSYEASRSVASASRVSEASVSSAASASAASASAAAAVPSAACKLWEANFLGLTGFFILQVYGINAWGKDGSSLHHEEKGCGALTGWEWQTGCDGDTSQAWFRLPVAIRAGCVERAIHSAGGPARLQCEGMGSVFLVSDVRGGTPCRADSDLAVNKVVMNEKVAVANTSANVPSTTHVLAVPGNTAAAEANNNYDWSANATPTMTAAATAVP